MSVRVILRPEVPGDLHAIVAHLEVSSVPVADRFAATVFETFRELADMPGMGSPKQFRSSRLAGIRSWLVKGFPNHLIYYRAEAGAIVIFAVQHGARNLRRLLGQRLG